MLFNLIVLAITLLVSGFVLVWCLFPGLRPWFEAPKIRMLEQERRFPAVTRDRPGSPGGQE
jgi:hypothetical protein